MFGSRYARLAAGEWSHLGYFATTGLPDENIRKFTPVVQEDDNEEAIVLSSGQMLGIMTQDVGGDDLTTLQGFKNYKIGKLDNPVKHGNEVSVRIFSPRAQLEFEGAGAALPGNLVDTAHATKKLTSSTPRFTELTLLNGCLQKAASADWICGTLERIVPSEVDDANLRVLWTLAAVQYKKP